MNPFFFGSSASPLFGAYHPPEVPSRSAALLCYPIAHEYMRCHWAMRQLARRLQQAGFHVLRFDYSGTGDSQGTASLDAWRQDLVAAAAELRDTSGATALTVVGVRFGATLAALEADTLGAERLVLWDLVSSGRRYLRQLRSMHAHALADPNRFDQPRGQVAGELLGCPWPDALSQAIEAVELGRRALPGQVDIIASTGEPARGLADRLTDAGTSCAYREVADACGWGSTATLDDQLLAPLIVSAIAGILEP